MAALGDDRPAPSDLLLEDLCHQAAPAILDAATAILLAMGLDSTTFSVLITPWQLTVEEPAD